MKTRHDASRIASFSVSGSPLFRLLLIGISLSAHAADNRSAQTPAALYHLDESSGTLALDSSGNGHNAVVNGATYVPGFVGTALRFRGDTLDEVTLPSTVFSGFGNTAYFEAMIRPTAFPYQCANSWGMVFMKDSPYNAWHIAIRPDGSLTSRLWGATHSVADLIEPSSSPNLVPLNVWTKIAAWYDGASYRLYVNDREVARQDHAMALDWSVAYAAIGGARLVNCENQTFTGDIDEVLIAASPTPKALDITPTSLSISADAFRDLLSVNTSNPSLAWTASASSSGGWLQITTRAAGNGLGTIGYSASANSSTSNRTGTITVNGQVFTLLQYGTQQGTPFALVGTPRCWTGYGNHPAGPGVLLAWTPSEWGRYYSLLRDGDQLARADQPGWFDVTGLTPGQSYTYQIGAAGQEAMIYSAKVHVVAPMGCSTITPLRVEEISLTGVTFGTRLTSGTSTSGKVRLSAPAPRGGATVMLTSSKANLTLPVSVTVPEGLGSASFTAVATNVSITTGVTITATVGTSSLSKAVSIWPGTASGGIAFLLLHGLNSDPGTWRDLIRDRATLGYCDLLSITGSTESTWVAQRPGQIYDWDPDHPHLRDEPANGCYALEFNSLGLDGRWGSGDGLNYDQLGRQVGAAVNYIVTQQHPSAIVFVGHSRGGLAARAFLQPFQNATLPFKVGLITIGTPHLGSPFGRIKPWMDQKSKGPLDLAFSVGLFFAEKVGFNPQLSALTSLGAIGAVEILTPKLFSPSTGYLASTHNDAGKLDLCIRGVPNQALCSLDTGKSSLSNVVSAAGQIISTGFRLGENIFSNFSVLAPGNPLDLTAALPGENQSMIDYVFWNIPLNDGWRLNTDSVVPAASQRLDAGAPGISPLTTKYLDKIRHTSETGQTDCITQVLDAVITQPALTGLTLPISPPEAAALSEQSSTRALRLAAEERIADPETAATRVRVKWLNTAALVETALEGDRLNNLEGLLSRQEIRQRDATEQQAIVAALRQHLQSPSHETRAAAVRLLADVPAAYSGDPVVALLRRESDRMVRTNALKTLRTLAADAATIDSRRSLSQSVQRLADESTDDDPELFLASADCLVAIGGPDEVEKLMDLYQRSNEGRKQLLAASMMALRNGEGAQRLAAYLTVDPDLQQEPARLAGEVLSEISTEESVTGLLDWATTTETELQRSEALRWLKRVRTTRGKERLVTVVQQGTFKSEILRDSLQKQLEAGGQCTDKPATPIQ